MSTLEFTIRTSSCASTMRVAGQFVRLLQAPAIVLLEGALGAGKTAFVRGMVQELAGSKDIRVQSPTFSIAHAYETSPVVQHMDLYRLSSAAEAQDLGLDEMLSEENAFSCVEWPENAPDLFSDVPSHRLLFSSNASRNRRIHFVLSGSLDMDVDSISEQLQNAARGTRKPSGQ
jgi:tRNA threonylcarbamoyladenosine biosynthesis protein TsaE